MKDEDYAYGQWKQKQIDDGVLIGRLLADKDKIQRFANKDPHRHIPFVEPEAPTDGLMALYVVCTLLVAGYFAYIVWGVS